MPPDALSISFTREEKVMSDRTINLQAIAVGDIIGASGDDVENVCIVSALDSDVVRSVNPMKPNT